MKRMKKKVVAMVTLAMFVLSMVPMAAFAADENSLDVDSNKVEITDKAVVTLNTKDKTVKDVEVWVEKASEPGKAVQKATIATNDTNGATVNKLESGVATIESLNSGQKVKVGFPVAGDFVVKAGAWVTTKLPGVQEPQKDFVELATSEIITVTGCKVTALEAKAEVPVEYKNGYQLVPVEVTATGAEENAEVAIDNPYASAGIKVVDAKYNVIDKVSVDDNQEAEFFVTVENYTPAGLYNLDLACNGATGQAVIDVKAAPGETKVATTIEAPAVDGIISNDAAANFEAVKVVVKDQFGKVMTGSELTNVEPIMGNVGVSQFLKVDYVNVTKKPAKCTLADSDVTLKWDEKAQALELDATSALAKFIPGDYAIEFVLKNGAKATSTFTVGTFTEKDVKEVVIESKDNEEFAIPVNVDKDGVVTAAKDVNYAVFAVDANGIKKDITSAADVAFAPAVNGVSIAFDSGAKTFKPAFNPAVRDVIGTKVTLTAFDKKSNKFAVQDFTFVVADNTIEGLADYKLTFNAKTKEGKVLTQNEVTASLVDKKDVAAKDGTITYFVNETPVKVSDKNAKVIVKGKPNVATNGEFTIYSDKPVTVDVQVLAYYVPNSAPTEKAVYGETFSYTIGKEAIPSNTSVVMTLGSTEMVVNNNIVDMKDAAPFAQDNRTFVPFRALGEALGASVNYVAADNTVTYSLGGTEIVMTLDSKDYTVNGEKKTMDVAPFAKDGRTYVPVRFVGEALGFEVTALQNAAGQYVTVVFTK